MKTVISKRLAAIMPVNETIKINNTTYIAGIKFNNGMLFHSTDKDYTLNLDAKEFNFFCYNKNNKITCWPVSKGKQPVNDEGQWKKNGRTEIKPGKFLLLFTEFIKITDDCYDVIDNDEIIKKVITRTCEIFTDKIKGSNEEISFSLSSDISGIYETDYHADSGYLKNSCMRYGSGYGCQPYSGFYNLVPGLQIVYKKLGNSLLFRSLLWHCFDDNGNEVTFLDRIYGSEQINLQLIEKAKENGWAWRHFSDSTIYLNDKPIGLYCKIDKKAFNYLENEGSPYVDTLDRLTESSELFLSNYKRYDYELKSCDGTAVSNHSTCYNCNREIDENNCYHDPDGNMLCEYCFDENYFCCEHCAETISNDDRVDISDCNYCKDCAESKGYRECEHCGQWTTDTYYVNDECYCDDCYSDKCFYCEQCEEDHTNDEANNITLDGNNTTVCDDCLSNLNKCEECENYFTDELKDGLCDDCTETKENEEANKLQLTLEL